MRETSEFMDSLIGQQNPILDHGWITLCDYMGTEESIIQSARLSYQKGTTKTSDDVALIRYLMRHHHTTPFESCEIRLHVKLPIFVARQWIRHRTASVNEVSARYSVLDREFYIPEALHIQPQSTDNKQGRSGELTPEQIEVVQTLIKLDGEQAYLHYQALLGGLGSKDTAQFYKTSDIASMQDGAVEAMVLSSSQGAGKNYPGIARELARIGLSLNFYTNWSWKVNLHNLLHFLRLRMDPHAQYEIRVYAEQIAQIIQGWMPNTWAAFCDYQLHSYTLSAQEVALIRDHATFSREMGRPAGMSAREWLQFCKTFVDPNIS